MICKQRHDATQTCKDWRIHEWPCLVQHFPTPLLKHFDFSRGLMTGKRIAWALVKPGKAHWGKEIPAQAHILAFCSSSMVFSKIQSGLSLCAASMWCMSSVLFAIHIIPWFFSSLTKQEDPYRECDTASCIKDSSRAHFGGQCGQAMSVERNHFAALNGKLFLHSHLPTKDCHKELTKVSLGHFGSIQQWPMVNKFGIAAKNFLVGSSRCPSEKQTLFTVLVPVSSSHHRTTSLDGFSNGCDTTYEPKDVQYGWRDVIERI